MNKLRSSLPITTLQARGNIFFILTIQISYKIRLSSLFTLLFPEKDNYIKGAVTIKNSNQRKDENYDYMD